MIHKIHCCSAQRSMSLEVAGVSEKDSPSISRATAAAAVVSQLVESSRTQRNCLLVIVFYARRRHTLEPGRL
uniref:Uncharacterized protein n=1 Tax=Trichogramma kaykai TaxID=54128 RepID=A0ABD2X4N2_9HYME